MDFIDYQGFSLRSLIARTRQADNEMKLFAKARQERWVKMSGLAGREGRDSTGACLPVP